MKELYDILIIGGGPAGLYASFYAGLRDLSVCLLEAQEELGGKVNFYPEKIVWDIGALPPSTGIHIKDNLIEQASLFNPTIHTGVEIIDILKNENGFSIVDANGTTYHGRTVLIAIGGGVCSPQKINCSISKQIEQFVHYKCPNLNDIKDQHLVISGGGDSAVDYALMAHKYTSKVTLCYRGEVLKAHESQAKRLEEQDITVLYDYDIKSVESGINNSNLIVKAINNQETLKCDHLLVQHGFDCQSSLLQNSLFHSDRHQESYLKCLIPTQTTIAGVFVAGDTHYYEGKINLLSGAFHDATQAINQIKCYLEPSSQKQAMVSSHNNKFKALNRNALKRKSDM